MKQSVLKRSHGWLGLQNGGEHVRHVIVFVALMAVLVPVSVNGDTLSEHIESLNLYAIEEGTESPDFSLDALSGQRWSLSDLRGKVYCLTSGLPGVARAGRRCLQCRDCTLS